MSGSQLGAGEGSPARVYLARSTDFSGCHNWGGAAHGRNRQSPKSAWPRCRNVGHASPRSRKKALGSALPRKPRTAPPSSRLPVGPWLSFPPWSPSSPGGWHQAGLEGPGQAPPICQQTSTPYLFAAHSRTHPPEDSPHHHDFLSSFPITVPGSGMFLGLWPSS